jgi:diacylglycerol kinase (ATP)
MSTTDDSDRSAHRHGSLTAAAKLATQSFVVTVSQDRAVRRTVIGLLLLLPVAIWLPVGRLEHLILVLSMMLVVFAEILNSAIELVVDRISLESHPLSKAAKDTAAAAVVAALLMSGLCWTVIAAPVAWALLIQ